ncbi:TPA: hypothetical protein ACXNHW_004808 [Pseudomonas aeruginosa]
MHIIILILFVSILTGASNAFAVPPLAFDNRFRNFGVLFSVRNNQNRTEELYSATREFGGELIFESAVHRMQILIVFNVNNQSRPVHVAIGPQLERAAYMWNQRLRQVNAVNLTNLRITVLPRGSQAPSNFRIGFARTPDQLDFMGANSEAITVLIRAPRPVQNIDIEIFRQPGIYFQGEMLPYDQVNTTMYRQLFYSERDPVDYNYLGQQIVYLILAHEIGHAFGLAHPEQFNWVQSYDTGGTLSESAVRVYDETNYQTNAALGRSMHPIMISALDARLMRFMSSVPFPRRTLRSQDVVPSPMELLALAVANNCSIVWGQTRQPAMRREKRSNPNLKCSGLSRGPLTPKLIPPAIYELFDSPSSFSQWHFFKKKL